MAASLLLKCRNKFMTLAQSVISILLYAGHCSKQVFRRLNSIGLCVSHKQTLRIIRKLGEEYDKVVKEWKKAVESASAEQDVESDNSWVTESSISDDSEDEVFSSTEDDRDDSMSRSTISSVDSVPQKRVAVVKKQCLTYILGGNNVDKTVSPRYMNVDKQRQSLHYFQILAVLDRIDFHHLSNDKPIGEVATLPLSVFLPDQEDCRSLRTNYAILLGRELVNSIPYFKEFADCIPSHIEHKYSREMSQKSVVVPLGVLPNNEQYVDEMVSILEHCHQYVPVVHNKGEETYSPVPFFGDQLTAVRALTAKKTRVTSQGNTALRGLVPFCVDWHAKVNFIEIMWSRLYKGGSSLEGGTLQQLRNLISRRNIGLSTNVTGHVNEIEDFLETVIRCHLISAALHFFLMSNIGDSPHTNDIPPAFKSLPLKKRKAIFLEKLLCIVDRYVVPEQFCSHAQPIKLVPTLLKDTHSNPHLCRVMQEHDYIASPPVSFRTLPPSITQKLDRQEASHLIQDKVSDGVLDYASAVLNDGLFLLEFKDAIREGDGPRILRCWKVLLLYFKFANHHNYAAQAFRTLATVNALATPRIAAQITWSRVVNTRGQAGHNIAADLQNEHLNNSLKEAVSGLGANIMQQTVLQCGQSLSGIMNVCNRFDQQNNLYVESSFHRRPSAAKDEQLIIDELVKSKVFHYIPGRQHYTFRGIKPNPVQKINIGKLTEWIKQQKDTLQSEQNVAKLYKHPV